jgi:PAS domain S-box-containing protein
MKQKLILISKNINHFIILWFVFLSFNLSASSTKKDSLKIVLKAATNDSSRVKILNQLYQETDSVHYAKEGLQIAEKIKYRKGISQCLLDIGRSSYFDGDPDISLGYLTRSISIAEEIRDKKILISAYRYIGYIYRPDDPSYAEQYYNKSLRLAEETKDEIAVSYALSALGNIYETIFEGTTENNRKALQFYLRSLEIRKRVGAYDEIAASLNETSRVYDLLGYHEEALALRLNGIDIARKAGNIENIVFLCNVLGNDYSLRQHNFKKGLEYHLIAYNNALTQKNNLEVLFDISKGLAYDYRVLGDLKKSIEFYEKSIMLNDSLRAIQTKHDYNLSKLKHNLERELEQQKLLVKDSEILKGKAEAAKQTILLNSFILGFLLILVLVTIVYRANLQRKKSNKELKIQNDKIEAAYKEIAASEKKFQLITSTINDIFYLYNIRDKKYEYISPNCLEIVGLDQQWFYEGNSMNVIVLESDLPIVYQADVEVQEGKPYEIEYRIQVNGEIRWIAEKSSPNFDENGKMTRHSGVCRDITAKKYSENKFRIITETINDVFYLYNIVEKKYEYISPNCNALFGLDTDFFYSGKSMKTIVDKEDLALVIEANRQVDSGIGYDIEYRIIVDGQTKWVAEKSSPIFDEKNVLVRNSGICRDITQRKTDEEIIRKKNQDIKDSILYASTIQQAILTPKKEIEKRVKDFFILSKPKDIVSGDFHFYKETENGLIMAVADCTGHGVPGGFMSMLGNALLNEIINNNKNISPAEILDQLRKMIIQLLNQTVKYGSNKDGMDIALLLFEKNNAFVQYAGANIPLYIVQNGKFEMIMGDKLSIGIHIGSSTAGFTNHKIDLNKGDVIYLLSDGYADQFGGEADKRFSKNQLKDLLLSIHNKNMNEQEKMLNRVFEEWKGNKLQTDDVMAMGIKI